MNKHKPQLITLLQGWGLGLLLCTGMVASQAATSAGQFAVNITLIRADTDVRSSPGVCISQTLSEQSNALVRVVCSSGQFVSIEANPNRRFLGAHGGAFRYSFRPGGMAGGFQFANGAKAENFYPGAGTVTALRIYSVNGSVEPIEMLVTF